MKAIPKLWFEKQLWFEKLPGVLRWVVNFVILTVPFIVLDIGISYFLGVWKEYFVQIEAPSYILLIPLLGLISYICPYARRTINELQVKYEPLLVKKSDSLEFTNLSSLRHIAIVSMAFWGTLFFIFFYWRGWAFQISTIDAFLVVMIPGLPYSFAFGSFLWVYNYSMYATRKMFAKENELKLSAKENDALLGLGPFGIFLWKFTLPFFLGAAFMVIPANLYPGLVGLDVTGAKVFLLYSLALLFIGFFFFFRACIALRRQILKWKQRELQGIKERKNAIIEMWKQTKENWNETKPKYNQMVFGSQLSDEYCFLSLVDEDIKSVHDLIFNRKVLLALATVMMSMTTILLAKLVDYLLQYITLTAWLGKL